MNTTKGDAAQIADYFKPNVEQLVRAASLCWSEIDRAGVFDSGAAKRLVDEYCVTMAAALIDSVFVVDTETVARIPNYLKRSAIQLSIDQLEIDLGVIETYLDRVIKHMERLTEDM